MIRIRRFGSWFWFLSDDSVLILNFDSYRKNQILIVILIKFQFLNSNSEFRFWSWSKIEILILKNLIEIFDQILVLIKVLDSDLGSQGPNHDSKIFFPLSLVPYPENFKVLIRMLKPQFFVDLILKYLNPDSDPRILKSW